MWLNHVRCVLVCVFFLYIAMLYILTLVFCENVWKRVSDRSSKIVDNSLANSWKQTGLPRTLCSLRRDFKLILWYLSVIGWQCQTRYLIRWERHLARISSITLLIKRKENAFWYSWPVDLWNDVRSSYSDFS